MRTLIALSIALVNAIAIGAPGSERQSESTGLVADGGTPIIKRPEFQLADGGTPIIKRPEAQFADGGSAVIKRPEIQADRTASKLASRFA
jgi:hypothetical protein